MVDEDQEAEAIKKEMMVAIQVESETHGLILTQDEDVEKVLKHRPSYDQGLSAYIKPTTSCSTATSRTSEIGYAKGWDVRDEREILIQNEKMNKNLVESLDTLTHLDKMFMEQGAYRGNNTSSK